MRDRRGLLAKGAATVALAIGLVAGSGAVAASAHTGSVTISPSATQSQCQQLLSRTMGYW